VLAQIVRRNLARIGLKVVVKSVPFDALAANLSAPRAPFDIAWGIGWAADYSDPYAFINALLDGRNIWARFNSPKYNRLMDRASRLRGAKRFRAYGDLDIALARNAAPLIAYGTDNAWTFVSKRVSCKILRPELDLAAVCLKR